MKNRASMNLVGFLALAVLSILFAGCGPGPSPTFAPQTGTVAVTPTSSPVTPSPDPSPTAVRFIYAADVDAIRTSMVDGATGKIRPISKFRPSAGNVVSEIVSTTQQTIKSPLYVYAAIPGASKLFSYQANPATGALTALAATDLPNGITGGRTLCLDSTGGRLLVLCDSGHVVAYGVGADGKLTFTASVAAANSANNSGGLMAVSSTGFVYVSDVVGKAILGFKLGADGTLTAVPGAPFAQARAPHGLAVNPKGTFLYACLPSAENLTLPPSPGDVVALSIGTDGALTPVQTLPTSDVRAITLDREGKFAYALVWENATIYQFIVNADGTLAANGSTALWVPPVVVTEDKSRIIIPDKPHTVTGTASFAAGVGGQLGMDPSNSRLVAVGGGGYTFTDQEIKIVDFVVGVNTVINRNTGGAYNLQQLTRNADGTLTLLPSCITGSYPTGYPAFALGQAAATPVTRFAYSVNAAARTAGAFKAAADGLLSVNGVARETGAGGNAVGGVLVTVPGGTSPTGKFLFVVSQDNTVASFAVQADGTLGAPVRTQAGAGGVNTPVAILANLDGRSLYVVNSTSPSSVSRFEIATDGTLTAPAAPKTTDVNEAVTATIDPQGKSLVVVHKYVDKEEVIIHFPINPDGTLATYDWHWAIQASDSSLAYEPPGTYFFAAVEGANALQYNAAGYRPVPVAGTAGFIRLAVDPLGVLLAAIKAGAGPDNVGTALLSQDGNATATPKATTTAADNATSVTFDFSGRNVYVSSGTGADGDSLSQFQVQADGTLKSLGPAVTCPGGPIQVLTTGDIQ